ncbi:hypothetical protein JW935_02305 [candidate division KSB1 bacterium]|nr:hypothetical protein [candidate division KSB1 bacterium]
MKMRIILSLFLLWAVALYAVKPKFKTISTMPEFERGELKNVTILKDGNLSIGLQGETRAKLHTPYVWCAVTDKMGNIYLGTGNNGKIWKITSKDTSLFFQAGGLAVSCILCGPNGDIYAGTLQEGKVYKINTHGEGTVFFETTDSYIWDMTMDSKKNLYVATGVTAQIYKITPKGSQTIFKSEQTHVKSLCIDQGDNLYAGTSDNGYIYKLQESESAFVLFDTQMEEVHSIVASADGDIYAAAFGESTPAFQETHQRERDEDSESADQNSNGDIALAPQSIIPESFSTDLEGPSALFKINRGGYAKDLWLGNSDRIYSLLSLENVLYIGTGNEGKLYQCDKDENISLIYQFNQSQLTTISPYNQAFIVGTANMGECFQLGPDMSDFGEFTSETMDASLPAEWGIVKLDGKLTDRLVTVFVRSGNTQEPEQSWSSWQQLSSEGNKLKITCPSARFIQLKCRLERRERAIPVIKKITISYVQKNFAPQVNDILIHRPGDYYSASSDNSNSNSGNPMKGLVYPQQLGEADYKKGYRSVDWLFEDPNFDGLSFDIYYRLKDQDQWFKLTSDLVSNVYSWDSSQMQDGQYEIKIVASDSLSNPIGHAIHEKISEPFEIDNTGPIIENIVFENRQSRFSVRDASVIGSVFYSINAGGWRACYPVDGLVDSEQEQFQIDTTDYNGTNLELAIKAQDEAGNYSVVHKNKGK